MASGCPLVSLRKTISVKSALRHADTNSSVRYVPYITRKINGNRNKHNEVRSTEKDAYLKSYPYLLIGSWECIV